MPRKRETTKFRIGEKVTTQWGEGLVLETQSWSQAVGALSDAEAQEFTRRLSAMLGTEFKKKWQRVYVGVGNRAVWIDNTDSSLRLLESRDV